MSEVLQKAEENNELFKKELLRQGKFEGELRDAYERRRELIEECRKECAKKGIDIQ